MRESFATSNNRLERLAAGLKGRRLPAAVVDLGGFEANARALFAIARAYGKPLRVASKSIRCVDLLRRLAVLGGDSFGGIMAFAIEEAAFLVHAGFSDILVAYPTVQVSDIDLLLHLNSLPEVSVTLVVDDLRHVRAIESRAAKGAQPVPVVIDVDLSLRMAVGKIHLGVRRSPVRSPKDVRLLAAAVRASAATTLSGLMAYEAQVAGMADRPSPALRSLAPLSAVSDGVKRLIKRRLVRLMRVRRRQVRMALEAAGVHVRLFNGGGTGSLHLAAQERAITEVTAGSGFLCSHLFDHDDDLHLLPSQFFAAQVVRIPDASMATCLGGGFIASGEAGPHRLPLPVWPRGLQLLPLEGAGEVQTPLVGPGVDALHLGDAVLFRHGKTGELAEHFNHYLLMRDGEVEASVPTYRGQGQAFL